MTRFQGIEHEPRKPFGGLVAGLARLNGLVTLLPDRAAVYK
jgi:hypothetical protein